MFIARGGFFKYKIWIQYTYEHHSLSQGNKNRVFSRFMAYSYPDSCVYCGGDCYLRVGWILARIFRFRILKHIRDCIIKIIN